MTLREYGDIKNYIVKEYNFYSHQKVSAEVYGLPWSDADQKNLDEWIARYRRVMSWEKEVLSSAAGHLGIEDFRKHMMGGKN